MDSNDLVTLLAQSENGQFRENGIQYAGSEVMGINRELGLLVLAQGEGQGIDTAAYKSVEILMDDMMLNLSATGTQSGLAGSEATQCLQESLDNINEYLCSQSGNGRLPGQGVALAAIQLQHNQFSCCRMGGLDCLRFSDNQLQAADRDLQNQQLLGVDKSFQPAIMENHLSQGDILLLTSNRLLTEVGKEFIRITLSRFSDNLEMAVRQINTRALRSGFEQNPGIILCRVDQASEGQSGWLNKFRGS